MDDYELSFSNHSEAEEALGLLEENLGHYELALNPRKTDITDLPLPLESPRIEDLRRFTLRSGRRRGQSDLIAYFDIAFRHKRSHPDEPILRYALGRIRKLRVHPDNWPVLEDLVLQSLAVEPGIIAHAIEQVIRHERQGLPIQLERWEALMSDLIVRHGRIGHGSEVAWSLQACIALKLPVEDDAAKALSGISDSVVALLALHAHSLDLIPGLDLTHWSSFMHGDNLYGDQWLLAYEANVKGWLPSTGSVDHVQSHPRFAFLKSNDVEFYDLARAALLIPSGMSPSLGMAPFFVLPGEGYDDGAEASSDEPSEDNGGSE